VRPREPKSKALVCVCARSRVLAIGARADTDDGGKMPRGELSSLRTTSLKHGCQRMRGGDFLTPLSQAFLPMTDIADGQVVPDLALHTLACKVPWDFPPSSHALPLTCSPS